MGLTGDEGGVAIGKGGLSGIMWIGRRGVLSVVERRSSDKAISSLAYGGRLSEE